VDAVIVAAEAHTGIVAGIIALRLPHGAALAWHRHPSSDFRRRLHPSSDFFGSYQSLQNRSAAIGRSLVP
jgi:hypothetical protein